MTTAKCSKKQKLLFEVSVWSCSMISFAVGYRVGISADLPLWLEIFFGFAAVAPPLIIWNIQTLKDEQ